MVLSRSGSATGPGRWSSEEEVMVEVPEVVVVVVVVEVAELSAANSHFA